MQIALTGATGGVGTALCRAARARGDSVRALVRDPSKAAELSALGVDLVRGDLDDERALEATAKGAAVFVHTAAQVGDWGTPELFERVNVGGTRRAVEAAARAGVRRFVQLSSVAVYGRPDHGIIDETRPRKRLGLPYEDTKIGAEETAFDHGAALGLEVAAVRPPVIFGPHDRVFMPRVIANLRARRAVLVDGGRWWFNVASVDDVVDVTLRCAESPNAVGEAFNVAADPRPTVKEVFDAIADGAGLPRVRRSLPRGVAMALARALDAAWKAARAKSPPPLTPFVVTLFTRDVVYDASKARRLLGWEGGRDAPAALRALAARMTAR